MPVFFVILILLAAAFFVWMARAMREEAVKEVVTSPSDLDVDAESRADLVAFIDRNLNEELANTAWRLEDGREGMFVASLDGGLTFRLKLADGRLVDVQSGRVQRVPEAQAVADPNFIVREIQ